MFTEIVALSGGMDSSTVLGHVADRFDPKQVLAVGFDYGSKHGLYEQYSAARIARYFGVQYELIDVTGIFRHLESNLLQSGPAIPEGHYHEETMRQTVVPGRNLFFISVLAAIAQSRKAQAVWLGIHSGDHHIYPDCRPEFFDRARQTVQHSSDGRVILVAPFLQDNKEIIIRTGRGFTKPVPYELTRTCYKDQVVACGRCGSCQERLEAFKAVGIEDPLGYETRELLPKSTN